MSRDYYSEINLHLVWHTKESAPMLRGDVEAATHEALRRRIIQTPGVFVHDIGGIDDHVHLAVTIPPTLLVSDFVGQLKGGTAFEMNKKFGTRGKALEWQSGYGVVSFGTRDLQWVRNYIQHQREHHDDGKAHNRLERSRTPRA